MSTKLQTLGSCSECGAAIPGAAMLIEYETSDGSAVYADCPDCRAVVHPI